MHGVTGQWNASLSINGQDFPINPTTVPNLMWHENVHQYLPTLNLTIADVTGDFATAAAAGDGVPIDLILGDGATNQSSATFNIQGAPKITPGNGYNLLHINAVLDKMSYLRGIIQGFHNGTSASVISSIAAQHGLQAEVDQTADSQVWLPNNKTIASFLRGVTNHGFVNEGSCMVTAVMSTGKLLYKNVMQAADSNVHFGQDGFNILDWNSTSKGMITNNVRGYGSTTVGYKQDGTLLELGKITFDLFSNFLSAAGVNIDSIGGLGTRIEPMVRPSGNTHDKYIEAAHQNQRQRALFSADLNILTDHVTPMDLLTKASAIPVNMLGSVPNDVVAGTYLVTSRTRSLLRNKYVEKIVLTGQSLSG